jgi:DNA-binding NarL/FixJ family response regulator
MNPASINVLIVEDEPGQALLIEISLGNNGQTGFRCEHADTLAAGWERLAAGGIDVVLLDLTLPDSTGFATLAKTHEKFSKVPLVVLTGLDDDALGLQLVQAGAQDYLPKGQVTPPLLARTLRYAIERKHTLVERERLLAELQAALAEVKTLSGLIPMCANCKKIRDDTGYWNQVESYIAARTDANFTHGICPECAKKLYPDLNLYPDPPEKPSNPGL